MSNCVSLKITRLGNRITYGQVAPSFSFFREPMYSYKSKQIPPMCTVEYRAGWKKLQFSAIILQFLWNGTRWWRLHIVPNFMIFCWVGGFSCYGTLIGSHRHQIDPCETANSSDLEWPGKAGHEELSFFPAYPKGTEIPHLGDFP